MPTVYLHYFGTESAKKLLEAKGVIQHNNMNVNLLKSKSCPHCSVPNKPDARFCMSCKMILTLDAYTDTINEAEESKKRLEELEAKHEILQANTATVLNALIAAELGIKSPQVKIIAWRSDEGHKGLFEAAAIARAENEAREKEHQLRHHKQ
jgi:hypothetical protein